MDTKITTFAQAMEHLSTVMPGYEARPAQVVGAGHIEQAIASGEPLVIQAPTGSGKSLMGAIPAILSGKRTVIATSTIALMMQYAREDMPWLAANLGVEFSWMMLKGRSNYVCLNRLADNAAEVSIADKILQTVRENPTHDGDKEHFDFEIEPREWSKICSERDSCGDDKRCKKGGCYAVLAKARAAMCDVVITNTAMLLIDAVISTKTEGFVSMLGEYDVLVVDECHLLEKAATNAFGDEIRPGAVIDLVSKVRTFVASHDGEPTSDTDVMDAFKAAWALLGQVKPGERMRAGYFVQHIETFEALVVALHRMDDELAGTKIVRGDGEIESRRKQRLLNTIRTMRDLLIDMMTFGDSDMVRWVETWTNKRGEEQRLLKMAPVTVSGYLNENLWNRATPILMSATIATNGGDFSFIKDRLGFAPATKHVMLEEVFDYEANAMLFVPTASTPDPSPRTRAAWSGYASAVTLDLIRAAGGGALLLFTSRRAMNDAYENLAGVIQSMGYATYIQGQGSNEANTKAFLADEDSVLFGLESFMTGFSAPGRTCRLVVIDKMPFPVPSEPIYAARAEELDRTAHNQWVDGAFPRLSVPLMTLTLQQAFGRLIRTKTDRGVVAILDSRLRSKKYGTGIVRSLPSAENVSDLERVRQFFTA